MKTRLVVATRKTEMDFFEKTATGQSLAFSRREMADFVSFNKTEALELRLFPENTRGLPSVYNDAIREARSEDIILVFAHDDLHLLDYFWVNRVQQGLEKFDLIGLAGNRRRVPRQPAWAFVNTDFTWDSPEHLSGIVGQGASFPPEVLFMFGPTCQPVKLLDGLLLAIKSQTLRLNDLWFDERFDFNHYDLDLCRQIEQRGMACGTWDISVVHQSYGDFRSAAWKSSYNRYIEKWRE
jgi:hypothetical protein